MAIKYLFLYLNQHAEALAVAVTLVAAAATILRKVLLSFVEALTIQKMAPAWGALRKSDAGVKRSGAAEGRVDKAWKTRDSATESHSVARGHVVIRLNDAKTAMAQEESSAKVSRILSGSLTFAQVVIGGVLASSFVQEALPPKTVGIFGVLVLIASLVKQQYRPDVDAEQAQQKSSKLQALIRSSEDELATIDARSAKGEDRTDALIDLRNQISRGITQIENPEAVASKLLDANRAENRTVGRSS
ncbi:MAG TPA: hypothetical protein VGM18_12945 [Candidatus Sulfotelmatobacter sp.]